VLNLTPPWARIQHALLGHPVPAHSALNTSPPGSISRTLTPVIRRQPKQRAEHHPTGQRFKTLTCFTGASPNSARKATHRETVQHAHPVTRRQPNNALNTIPPGNRSIRSSASVADAYGDKSQLRVPICPANHA
jgi:hypothetical protein